MLTSKELAALLNRDDVRGAVIKDLAFLDVLVIITVGMYLSPKARTLEFVELVGDRLSFNDKMSILEGLKLRKKYKATECFSVIRQLQQIRNLMAHTHLFWHGDRKLQNPSLRALFDDYPKSYREKVSQALRQLRRLGSSKEFTAYHGDDEGDH